MLSMYEESLLLERLEVLLAALERIPRRFFSSLPRSAW
jgi:hypothetical protein